LSVLLFHGIEEPGRRWMRRMIGARPETPQVTPAEDPLAVESVDEILDKRAAAVPVSVS
jgi:peptidoglycan/LPS O-acetylase OafA/YrhL